MQVWFSFFEEKKEKTDFIKENQFFQLVFRVDYLAVDL